MNMLIYIPTYKRVGRQYTWKSLTPELRALTYLVCPLEEVAKHEAAGIPATHLIPQAPHIKTIAQKREWITHECALGTEKFLMLDDDLEFHARYDNKETGRRSLSRRGATPERVNSFFQELCGKLDSYAHVGISARQTNSTQPDISWGINQRMMYAFGYRTEVARKEIEFGRVKFREDFDYTLQLLRKGYANVVGFEVCVDPKAYAAQGGCSEERDVASSNEEAEKLAALHPEFVKVVEKKYKTSLPRKEVTVYWKKAFASSGVTS